MTPTRRAISLDGEWQFVADPARRLTPSSLAGGTPIHVPGAWEAQLPEPYGIVQGWYRRRFSIPSAWPRGDLLLRFGGAAMEATVWLDGRLVRRETRPYLPFEVEAGAVDPDAEHELVVAVANPLNVITEYPAFGDALESAVHLAAGRFAGLRLDAVPHGKQNWYTSTSGLLGSVAAELAPRRRFGSVAVESDVAAREVVVRWQPARNPWTSDARVRLRLTAPGGRVVADRSLDAGLGSAVLPVGPPERWGLWEPALYHLEAQLLEGGTSAAEPPADEVVNVRFGLRSIAVRDGRILLNGRQLYVRGVLDQDFWPVGRSNPPSRAALEAQTELVRQMGFNLIRCHIKVPDPVYVEIADEVGLPLWCELPSWDRSDAGAAKRARSLLSGMVDTLGQHPSIVIWSIVNEDWGTDLRHSARDRRWLRDTADWLKERDPSRLVVDNSACETPHGPNFHLRTDIADFHAYRSVPDGAARWRHVVGDFARRPSWLWSPFGDATPTGNEALVMSEFGCWGLPAPSAVRDPHAADPWWFATGDGAARPAGIEQRFRQQGLDRIWSDADALAVATQWQQFEGLVSQIRELRRQGTIQGYVVTELSDAFWEANGLLDVRRGRKAFHARLAEINAEDVLVLDLPRSDLWAGETLECAAILATRPDRPDVVDRGGRITWRLRLANGTTASGSAALESGPSRDVAMIARIRIRVPRTAAVTDGELLATATSGGRRATYRQRVVVVPPAASRSGTPRRIATVDHRGDRSINATVEALGHQIVELGSADVILATSLDANLLDLADDDRAVVALARAPDAIPPGVCPGLALAVEPRRPDGDLRPDPPWAGDWTSVFAWALPGVAPGLPRGGLLNEAHAQVYPDHVLTGLDVADPDHGVSVGMFAGWVHRPAALLARLSHGRGRITITTLKLSPEDGPVATAFLESIIQAANGRQPA